MEIEVISRELIKPYSPTPEHLKTYKLSLLDQYAPTPYLPFVLYFPTNQIDPTTLSDSSSNRSLMTLKQSLSQALTHFYPFAGRIRDNLSIDCNDEGAYYAEAKTSCNLTLFLNQPDNQSIRQFLPMQETNWAGPTPSSHLLLVQVTSFSCGGIAISACISHVICDGFTYHSFLRLWAAIARNSCEPPFVPDFELVPQLFPQNESLPIEATMQALLRPFFKFGKCGTRRLRFDLTAIAKLKAKLNSSSVKHPSSVEVVSALIWKRAMEAWKLKNGAQNPSLITHAVNFRSNASSPVLPKSIENSMSNLFMIVPAKCTPAQEAADMQSLVYEVRESRKRINDNLIREMQGEEGYVKLVEVVNKMSEEISDMSSNGGGVEYIGFTSWCKFGHYDIDFGWGKPLWVATAASPGHECFFVNFIMLFDTRKKNGIEAWVNLDEDVLAVLQSDPELLQFALVDPSPISIN